MSRPHLPKEEHAFPRSNGFLFDRAGEIEEVEDAAAAEQSGSPSSSFAAASPAMSSCGQYMLHRVGKLDTLAGIAIKYGVEVADIKRLNALSTDLQMFAHKTLRIPLPGRHPPSSYQNGSYEGDDRECTPPRRLHDDILDSVLRTPRHKVSPAMSLLQGYYGLTPPPKKDTTHEGTEMAVYGKGKSVCLDDDPWFGEPPDSDPFSFQHRKTRSLAIGSSLLNGETEENGDSEKSIRRRQKVDGELLPREENGSAVLARAGKGLALRPKSGSRQDLNKSQQNLMALAEPSISDGLHAVRKSSSTPEFQEPESNNNSSSSSIWSTSKWTLKPDAFTLPLPLPLFDNIPKPIAAWRNKAARD
uniref:LysM domain-containing protein n=1 Tax=Leersia perrieri TaxID=77586 RepID=A0A0D9XKU5_9ORYZ